MDALTVTRTRVVCPPAATMPVRIPDILAYLQTCVPTSSPTSLTALDRLMGAAMEIAFRDAKRRLRDEVVPFSGTPEGLGMADTMVQNGSIDRVERAALDDVVALFLALGYRPLEAATWEAASEEDFILTLPVTVDWGALDDSMLSAFWKRRDPELYARLPETARDRILILHRGLDISTLQGSYLDVKLDALGSFLVIRPLLRLLVRALALANVPDLAQRIQEAVPTDLKVKGRRNRDAAGKARKAGGWKGLWNRANEGARRCPASGKLAAPGSEGGCPFARFAARKRAEEAAGEGTDAQAAAASAAAPGGEALPPSAAPADSPTDAPTLPPHSPVGIFTLMEDEQKRADADDGEPTPARAETVPAPVEAAVPKSAAGGEVPKSAAGGEVPKSAAGGEVPKSAAGGEMPKSAAGGEMPKSAAGGEVPKSAAGGEVSKSAAGGEVPKSAAGGEVTLPAAPLASSASSVSSSSSSGLHRTAAIEVERRTFTRVLRSAGATLSLLFKPLQLQDAAFHDVVVLYRRSRAPAGTLGTASPSRLEAIRRQLHLRRFQRVPIADLELVFPDKHISIPPLVWIQLGVTVLAAVVAILVTLRSGAAAPGPDGKPASSSSSMNTLYAAAVLLFSRAFQVYSTVSFRRTSIETQLGALLYDHSVASQNAVVVSALDELGVQHGRQVLLTYGVLAATGKAAGDAAGDGARTLARDELEVRVETLLRNEWGVNARVDAEPALRTLVGWGVVRVSGTDAQGHDVYAALPPEQASEKLRLLIGAATTADGNAGGIAGTGVHERDLLAGIAAVLPERD